jgi:hypothetical protein
VDIREVERRPREHRQRLAAGDSRRKLAAEHLVDDEARVVALDIEIPEQAAVGGDVDRDIAVGEDAVDFRLILRLAHGIDLGVEGRFEPAAGVIDDGDYHVSAVAHPRVLVGNALGGEVHTGYSHGVGFDFGATPREWASSGTPITEL